MSTVKRRLLLATALATTLTMAAPAAAGAAPKAQQKDSHCVMYVLETMEDGELKMSDPTCVATRDEAAELAALPNFQLGLNGLDGAMYGYGSLFTLGIHYNGFNGSGSSITVVGSSCTGGWWNTPTWFDNKESSSYNGCGRLRHYDRPNKNGAGANTYGAGTTDNIPGYMNNRAESVAYYNS